MHPETNPEEPPALARRARPSLAPNKTARRMHAAKAVREARRHQKREEFMPSTLSGLPFPQICGKITAYMVEWRSGSAGALQAQGRGFKSLLDHHQ